MGGTRFSQIYRGLLFVLVALYVIAGLVGGFAIDFDDGSDQAFWIVFLLGGAALLLLGYFVFPSGWLSALLVSIGAAAGALPLFWTIVVPLAAAATIALSLGLARRPSAPA